MASASVENSGNARAGVWSPVFSVDKLTDHADVKHHEYVGIQNSGEIGNDIKDDDSNNGRGDDEKLFKAGMTGFGNTTRHRTQERASTLNAYASDNDVDQKFSAATAARKPLQMDWDSDDEIIWQMKTSGYKDEPVRDRLIQENRTRYDAKTIATRYSRMKKMVAAHEEKTLDESFSDFHEEEDKLLYAAVREAEAEYQRELERANNQRWQTVTEYMKRDMGRPKYTKNTARARYASLLEGTAILPIEQDPNAEARTAHRLHARLERQAAAEAQRIAEKTNRENKQREKAELLERKEAEREAAEAERERRRLHNARVKAAAKARAESKLKIKTEVDQEKANKATIQAIERSQKRKAKEDGQVAKAWQRDQEKVARLHAQQQAELDKIQAEAERKRREFEETNAHNQRRQLIRRFMRGAGLKLAAPVGTLGSPVDEAEKKPVLTSKPLKGRNSKKRTAPEPAPSAVGDGAGKKRAKIAKSKTAARKTPLSAEFVVEDE